MEQDNDVARESRKGKFIRVAGNYVTLGSQAKRALNLATGQAVVSSVGRSGVMMMKLTTCDDEGASQEYMKARVPCADVDEKLAGRANGSGVEKRGWASSGPSRAQGRGEGSQSRQCPERAEQMVAKHCCSPTPPTLWRRR